MKGKLLIVKSTLLLGIVVMLAACGGKDKPDVSGINVSIVTQRFDRDFFSLDTLQLDAGLNHLQQKYPLFLGDFMVKVLGINPADPMAPEAIKSFIRSYKPIADTANLVAEKSLPAFQEQLVEGLRYMKYYFPKYAIDSPFVVTPFIGPMDVFEPFSIGDYGDVRTRNGVGIALQLHLGANATVYEQGRREGLFFDYQTRRFTPDMMVVNSMKNVLDDAFPYNPTGKALVEEMIEKGKRLYVLDKLLPDVEDSLKIGYTANQLKGCYNNEAVIWGFFITNDLLYSKEPAINKLYIKDGPKTQELGEQAPGYIGLFVGRQIVRAFMQKNKQLSLEALMQKDAKELLDEAGYKP